LIPVEIPAVPDPKALYPWPVISKNVWFEEESNDQYATT
jgi:hypothetical protein